MAKNKLVVTVVIIAVVVGAIVGIKLLKQGQIGVSPDQARSKGDKNAPIKIVEYADFQCPMCATGANKLKDYMDRYPGKFHVEMRYFPLDMHKHAFVASQYAECAALQGKFWPMHDVIFDNQKKWSEAVNAIPIFDIYAKEIGLNVERLKACLPSKEVDERIEGFKKEGRDLGVRSTPTYFINGEMVVGIKVLEEKLNLLLSAPPTEKTSSAHP